MDVKTEYLRGTEERNSEKQQTVFRMTLAGDDGVVATLEQVVENFDSVDTDKCVCELKERIPLLLNAMYKGNDRGKIIEILIEFKKPNTNDFVYLDSDTSEIPDSLEEEDWLLLIVDKCNNLQAEEEFKVKDFGENKDLLLHITKDCDFHLDKDPDAFNMVQISTLQRGKWVDDTGDTYVTDGTLYRELKRIYHYMDFKTL